MTVYLTIREKKTGLPGQNKGRKNDAFFKERQKGKKKVEAAKERDCSEKYNF